MALTYQFVMIKCREEDSTNWFDRSLLAFRRLHLVVWIISPTISWFNMWKQFHTFYYAFHFVSRKRGDEPTRAVSRIWLSHISGNVHMRRNVLYWFFKSICSVTSPFICSQVAISLGTAYYVTCKGSNWLFNFIQSVAWLSLLTL